MGTTASHLFGGLDPSFRCQPSLVNMIDEYLADVSVTGLSPQFVHVLWLAAGLSRKHKRNDPGHRQKSHEGM